jgi:hypothetical protein
MGAGRSGVEEGWKTRPSPLDARSLGGMSVELANRTRVE